MKNLQAWCMVLFLSTATVSVSVCAADKPTTTTQTSSTASSAEQPKTTEQKFAELEARVKGVESWKNYNRFSFVMGAVLVVVLALNVANG